MDLYEGAVASAYDMGMACFAGLIRIYPFDADSAKGKPGVCILCYVQIHAQRKTVKILCRDAFQAGDQAGEHAALLEHDNRRAEVVMGYDIHGYGLDPLTPHEV